MKYKKGFIYAYESSFAYREYRYATGNFKIVSIEGATIPFTQNYSTGIHKLISAVFTK